MFALLFSYKLLSPRPSVGIKSSRPSFALQNCSSAAIQMDNDCLDVNHPITACQQALLIQLSQAPFEKCKAMCVCWLQQPCSLGRDEHQPDVPSGTCVEEARPHVCGANSQQENGLMREATGSQCIAPDSDHLAQNLLRHPSTFPTED